MLRSNLLLSALLLSLALGLGACGDDDVTPTDAGPTDTGVDMPDTGPPPPDSGPMFVDLATCDMPRMVTGEIGDVTVTGDTTLGAPGPRDMGTQCNNQMAMRWAPQEVIEYVVPGTGPVGINFSLANSGTASNFDTLVQVRTESCTTIPTPGIVPTCFDDGGADEIRTAGAVAATGGDTIHFIVTGWSETDALMGAAEDRGTYSLVITARVNDLPEVTGGEVRAIGTRGEVEIEGSDDDDDALGFIARFQDAAGAAVDMDMDGDGTLDGNQIAMTFDDITGTTAYTGMSTVEQLGDALRFAMPTMATQAEVQLIDDVFAFGPVATIPVRYLNEVGLGATCDAMNICARPLTCNTSMACEAPPELVTACAAATAITIATPTDTTTTATVTGTLGMGTGPFVAPCAYAGADPDAGPEVLYSLAVPTGTFDLLVRTDLTATGSTDTVVWARSTCEDPLTVVGCNDDIDTAGGVYQSQFEALDITEGIHTIFVEQWNGGAMSGAPFEMEVRLRPVLATGAACDMTGANNRCAGTACAAGTCP